MALVATLIANPQNPVLVPALGEKAASAVSASGLYWLADGIACDIALKDGTDAAEAMAALTAAIDGAPIDIVVQNAETRRKKLLIADMDSTMIGQECIDELAAEVGLKDLVAAITARAMNGEIEFEPALRERVALLKGLPVTVVDEVIAKRITLTPGGKELIDTMTANGGYTALVSGGFTVFTGRIASVLAFMKTVPMCSSRTTASLPASSPNPSSASRPRSTPSSTSPKRSASTPTMRLPSATAPTTSACSSLPAPAWRCMPSPRSRHRRRCALTRET